MESSELFIIVNDNVIITWFLIYDVTSYFNINLMRHIYSWLMKWFLSQTLIRNDYHHYYFHDDDDDDDDGQHVFVFLTVYGPN